MAVSEGEFAFDDELMDTGEPPTIRFLEWFHRNAGTARKDLHHTLGFGAENAAFGNHRHNGIDSTALLNAGDIPADVPSSPTPEQLATAVNGILAALRKLTGPTA